MKNASKILVTGAGGVLGAAIVTVLRSKGYEALLAPTKSEMNCLDEAGVERYFQQNRPTHVFHLASLVFGIKGNFQNQANSFRANTLMGMHVLDACARHRVEKVFYAGTVASYAYPYISMPLKEEDFWMGAPHAGEYGYALAKRGSLGHLQILRQFSGPDYCYGIFTNLYGPHDKFNMQTGHVIPSLIAKTFHAETNGDSTLEVWGKPETTRDFLFAADAAEAAVLSMEKYSGEINIASGVETSMDELAHTLAGAAKRKLQIKWVGDQPVGIPNRYCDVSRLRSIGFTSRHTLDDGLLNTLCWYREHFHTART
jgi:GDP-L-fucose synthase